MQIGGLAKRATKAAAYELVVDIKTGRRVPGPEEIDSLLLYFAPPHPKRAKTDLQWVAKAAAGVHNARPELRYVYVRDGVAVATDGHRAHRAPTTLADGWYDPRTYARVVFDGKYPDLDSVTPDRAACQTIAVSDLERGTTDIKTVYLRVSGGVAVDERYLLDALNSSTDGAVHYTEDTMAGDSEYGDWVIAGLRV